MYPAIIKEGRDQYAIMDVYYKGIWRFEKKYLLIYLSLLKARQETVAEKFSSDAFAAAEVSRGAEPGLVSELLNFVEREKMPVLCNFEPGHISSSLDKFEEGIITPPVPVVEVTSSCNYRCPWCYIPGNGIKQKGITSKEFERDLVVPMVSKFGLLSWCLSGGEPTLEIERTIEFTSIINRATERILGRRPVSIFLLTNGYDIERNAKSLLKAGINGYQISLASPIRDKEIALRRPPKSIDSYQHSIDGIRTLKSLGANVEINMVVQPSKTLPFSNIDDIEAMFELAHYLHIDKLRIIPAVPCGKAFDNDIFFTREDYEHISRSVRRLRPKFENEMIIDCPIEKEVEPDRSLFCGAGTFWLYVNHNGETFPCSNLQNPDASCSKGFGRSLADVWTDSKVLKAMRDYNKISIHDECVGCADRTICAADCRALCYARYKTFDLTSKPHKCFKYQ